MGLINTDRTAAEWILDSLSFTVAIGVIIVSAYLASIGYHPYITGGMAIGFGINFVTNYSMLLLRDNPDESGFDQFDTDDAEAMAFIAVVIQFGTLIIAGLYALFTVNSVAIGIAGSMVAITLYGVFMTGVRNALGVGVSDDEDTNGREKQYEESDSEWKFDADDFE
jgi:hypothetical protein